MPQNPNDPGNKTEQTQPILTSSINKHCITHMREMTLDEYEAAVASRGRQRKVQYAQKGPDSLSYPSRSRKKGDQDDAMQAILTKYTTCTRVQKK